MPENAAGAGKLEARVTAPSHRRALGHFHVPLLRVRVEAQVQERRQALLGEADRHQTLVLPILRRQHGRGHDVSRRGVVQHTHLERELLGRPRPWCAKVHQHGRVPQPNCRKQHFAAELLGQRHGRAAPLAVPEQRHRIHVLGALLKVHDEADHIAHFGAESRLGIGTLVPLLPRHVERDRVRVSSRDEAALPRAEPNPDRTPVLGALPGLRVRNLEGVAASLDAGRRAATGDHALKPLRLERRHNVGLHNQREG